MDMLSMAGNVRGMVQSIMSKCESSPAEPVSYVVDIGVLHVVGFIVIILLATLGIHLLLRIADSFKKKSK